MKLRLLDSDVLEMMHVRYHIHYRHGVLMTTYNIQIK